MRAGTLGAASVETLRRRAFALVVGLLRVSGGRETAGVRDVRRSGRAEMSWWTEEQDDVLREVSFRGAAYAAAEIERRCSVRHSVRAVGVKINRQTGMCPLCTERYHLEQERAFNEQLEREREACERSEELAEVRRERDMMRQRNSRLCRKYGLKGRRERKS